LGNEYKKEGIIMQKRKMKGYSIQSLVPLGVAFVVIAFVISMGGEILTSLQDDQTTDSVAYNVTGHGLDSMVELGSWLPTLALVVIAAIVIGVLITYLAKGAGRG